MKKMNRRDYLISMGATAGAIASTSALDIFAQEDQTTTGLSEAESETSNDNDSAKSNGKPPKWTIMVYLAGDGNLTAHCISVLQQLDAVVYNDNVRVLACFDSNTPAAKGSRYLEISKKDLSVKNGFDWGIHNKLIPPDQRGHGIVAPDFCKPNSDPNGQAASPSVVAAEGVRRFIEWSMEKHEKSEKYMLILMGHGPIVASQTFLAKENPPSFLRLADLRKVLSEHFGPERKLDILACNNCVMNGIETAVEVKGLCDFMLGSQGLVLVDGWPYREVISAVVENSDAPTEKIARKMLEACARNLLDFTLMERSSEQSVCDITKFGDKDNALSAIQELVKVLRQGLAFQQDYQALMYPAICDAVKLARLEAQSYWGETFVDLYDFCERLLQKCNDMALVNVDFLKQLGYGKCPPQRFRSTPLVRQLNETVSSCLKVLEAIKRMVPDSYYIGPDLQYSHGLSIYFPWTRPERPYFFTELSPGQFRLRTAFQTYREYTFDSETGWTTFLEDFFKATLRRVRRADRVFDQQSDTASLDSGLIGQTIQPESGMLAINLQKSSSDTGINDPEVWSMVKNYPRRNYLSPADCARRLNVAGSLKLGKIQSSAGTSEWAEGLTSVPEFEKTEIVGGDPALEKDLHKIEPVGDTSPPVSYLGWNITGLVAEVITGRAKKPASNGKSARSRIPEKSKAKV